MVDYASWANTANPGILAGTGQGLEAIAQGQQDRNRKDLTEATLRKENLEFGEREREIAKLKSVDALRDEVLSAHKSGDKRRMENALLALSSKDTKAAEEMTQFYDGLNWQNLVEASYPIMAAAASDDIDYQNKLLTQARDTLNLSPNHPIRQGMDSLIKMPKGTERDALLIETIEWLKDQGVYGKGPAKEKELEGGKKQKGTGFFIRKKDGKEYHVTPITDPNTGKVKLEEQAIGGEILSSIGESPEERQTREETTAGGKEREKGEETRTQGIINEGLSAAQSTSMIRRGIELLDSVKTGGFQSAALRAKQFLGVEGADEGELSNNLSKAVLSQLKATFGAAFTAEEGERLARIEAGFGKSTEANRRLLEQALKIAERKAQKALRQARQNNDKEAEDEINDWLKFNLGDETDQNKPSSENPKKVEKRRGTYNGRPVIEYEDGTVDYAD